MLIAAFSHYFFGVTICVTSLFLILLVLVQRGRGGGLTGALGGPGGQSAFGTKAGDLFTRITVGVAAVWICLCAAAVFSLKDREFKTNVTKSRSGSVGGTSQSSTENGANPAGTGTSSSGVTGADATSDLLPGLGTSEGAGDATADEGSAAPITLDLPSSPEGNTVDSPASGDAPAAETPAAETPAAETPAAETPAAEPSAETPAAGQ